MSATPEAPEVIDHAARAAVAMTQDTIATVIETVGQLSDLTRANDEAAATAIQRLGEIIAHLADRVRMLELDHEQGKGR